MPEAGREDSNKEMVEIGYSGMGEVWQELSRGGGDEEGTDLH